jgi:hypothetical protein
LEKNHLDETLQKYLGGATCSEGSSKTRRSAPHFKKKGKPSQKIEVVDLKENTTTSYNSLSEAARALNLPRPSIRKNLQSKNSIPYKDQYIFKLL